MNTHTYVYLNMYVCVCLQRINTVVGMYIVKQHSAALCVCIYIYVCVYIYIYTKYMFTNACDVNMYSNMYVYKYAYT